MIRASDDHHAGAVAPVPFVPPAHETAIAFPMQHAERRLRVIRQMLVWQLIASLGVGVLGVGLAGITGGWSALLGGLICWLPSCWFAYRAFRYRGARAARLIVRSFYAGEAGKLLLTMALFTLVFVNLESVNALALFAGFAGVQLVNWIVPIASAIADTRQTSR